MDGSKPDFTPDELHISSQAPERPQRTPGRHMAAYEAARAEREAARPSHEAVAQAAEAFMGGLDKLLGDLGELAVGAAD